MAQSLSNVLLHIIFSTKNCHPFIDENVEPELYAYMTSIKDMFGIDIACMIAPSVLIITQAFSLRLLFIGFSIIKSVFF